MKTFVRTRYDGYGNGAIWSWEKADEQKMLEADIMDTMVADDINDLVSKLESINPAPLGYTHVGWKRHNYPVTFEEPIRLISSDNDWKILAAEMRSRGKRSKEMVVFGCDYYKHNQSKAITINQDNWGIYSIIYDPKRKEKARKRRKSAQKKRDFPFAQDLDAFLRIARHLVDAQLGYRLNLQLSSCGRGYGLEVSVYAAGELLQLIDRLGMEMEVPDNLKWHLKSYDNMEDWLQEKFFPYIAKMRAHMWLKCNGGKGKRKCTCGPYKSCEKKECPINAVNYFCRWLVAQRWKQRKKVTEVQKRLPLKPAKKKPKPKKKRAKKKAMAS
jgi:hypothetical protein